MKLSDIISEIGNELDRSDIDARIKRWIQQSTDFVYNNLPFSSVERTASLTTVTSQETLALPIDFGEMYSLIYTPGDNSGYKLREVDPPRFFELYPDQNTTSFVRDFCVYNNVLHFAPLPASTYSLTLRYRIASPNIYKHNINITDDDSAATNGVLVYLDEDAVETGVGKLYFVSPTNTNAILRIATIDGHQHDLTIYDDDDAATLGVAVYLDEDGSEETERLLFISPTGTDCIVQTNGYRKHSHFVKFVDDDSAASNGLAIYCDEDQAVKTARLRFDSPSDIDRTAELVNTVEDLLPPFIERYHESVFLYSVAKGARWKKEYDVARMVQGEADKAFAAIMTSERRKLVTVHDAKPFTTRRRGVWDSLRWPEIDD